MSDFTRTQFKLPPCSHHDKADLRPPMRVAHARVPAARSPPPAALALHDAPSRRRFVNVGRGERMGIFRSNKRMCDMASVRQVPQNYFRGWRFGTWNNIETLCVYRHQLPSRLHLERHLLAPVCAAAKRQWHQVPRRIANIDRCSRKRRDHNARIRIPASRIGRRGAP